MGNTTSCFINIRRYLGVRVGVRQQFLVYGKRPRSGDWGRFLSEGLRCLGNRYNGYPQILQSSLCRQQSEYRQNHSVLPDKLPNLCNRFRGFRQKGCKPLKHMGHFIPYFKCHLAPKPGRMLCQSSGIIQQNFGVTYLQ